VKSLKSEIQSVRSGASKIAPSIAPSYSKPLEKIEEEKDFESSPQKTVASITPTILDQQLVSYLKNLQ
jgi:hypothetical protein